VIRAIVYALVGALSGIVGGFLIALVLELILGKAPGVAGDLALAAGLICAVAFTLTGVLWDNGDWIWKNRDRD
jgi:hypothetical protein